MNRIKNKINKFLHLVFDTPKKILVIIPIKGKKKGICSSYPHRKYTRTIVDYTYLADGPKAIQDNNDILEAKPHILNSAIWAQKNRYDAIVIACMADPCLKSLKKKITIPVVGTRETVMKEARKYGQRICIVYPENIPIVYLHQKKKAVIDKLTQQITREIKNNHPDVFVIGCTTIEHLAPILSKKTSIPVLGNFEYALDYAAESINNKGNLIYKFTKAL